MASLNGGTVKRSREGMKRPKSPGCFDNGLPPRSRGEQEEEEEEEVEEEREEALGRRPKRERRQGVGSGSSATLCQVCNIQLNSYAQAQIHYRGKTHQRRLRHLTKAAGAGTLSRSPVANPLLASLSLPGRPLQPQPHPQLELKHFLPLRVNGSTPLSLFPNFNAMDPVQKAVINHTFGVAPPKKKPLISCNICHLRFNSTIQAEAHYKGHKHARKLKALDTQRTRQRNARNPPTTGRERERGGVPPTDIHQTDITGLSSSTQPGRSQAEDGRGSSLAPTPASEPSTLDTPLLLSPLPSLQLSSGSQLPEPTSDSPPTPLEGCSLRPGPDPDSDPPGNPPVVGQEEGEEAKEAKKTPVKQQLHCPMCKVTVNSSSQLEAHYNGAKHKLMLDGQNGGQSRRRAKVASSPRSACRTKQPTGSNKSRTGVGESSQQFHCEVCQLSVNSDTQLKQHMSSRRHKERLTGRPPKPKFSPYTKVQPNHILATKLALQKHLSKALPAGFLPSPLNLATLCTMTSGPLALRPPPGPATIIQGPLLGPALFRPAPGPLRATHAPIIFSPY